MKARKGFGLTYGDILGQASSDWYTRKGEEEGGVQSQEELLIHETFGAQYEDAILSFSQIVSRIPNLAKTDGITPSSS